MKILTTILYSIFVCLIVGIAGLLIATMLPIPGNIEMKIVKSGSMEPAIPTGSLVVVKPQPSYALNDVITFGEDTKVAIPTTHRIVEVQSEGSQTIFITKGDANEENDTNPVNSSEVIGRVVFHVPYVGFILDFARQPIGFTLIIAIPAGLVIFEELLTIIREARAGMRRRRGDDDSGGGVATSESTSTVQTIYVKRRVMDDIFVPMLLEIENASVLIATRGNAIQKRLKQDSYVTSSALVMGLICVALSMGSPYGGTIAYFSDIEKSVGNLLRAGTWEDLTPPQPEVAGRFFESAALVDGESDVVRDEDTPQAPEETPETDEPGSAPEEPLPPLIETPEPTPIEEPAQEPIDPASSTELEQLLPETE